MLDKKKGWQSMNWVAISNIKEHQFKSKGGGIKEIKQLKKELMQYNTTHDKENQQGWKIVLHN